LELELLEGDPEPEPIIKTAVNPLNQLSVVKKALNQPMTS